MMKKVFLILAGILFAVNLRAVETIKVSELKPGMKGYGLSVFQGVKPERFEVELIDILPRALPDTDLILVKCSGAGLEKSRVIAGMSGSPVYFDGKLAGAIAYTWPFAIDPIAGVTPIESMLSSLQSPAKASVSASLSKAEKSDSLLGFQPVGNSIMVSGLAPSLYDEARAILESFNLGPVLTGGGKSEGMDSEVKLESGGAIGVNLVTGDIDISAVGTATLVEGNTVLAFGHPFFNGGVVSLPLSAAKVHTVLSSQGLSFKIASSGPEMGALKLDSINGISGRLGEKARMIPVKITVKNQATNITRDFSYQIADHPVLSPKLTQLCLYESLASGGAISDKAMVDLDMELKLEGYPEPIRYKDMFALQGSSFSNDYLAPVFIFSQNPYQKIQISEMTFHLSVREGWDIAEIKSIWANKTEVNPGDTVLIGVRLRKFQGDEFEKVIEFRVPEDAKQMVLLKFMGGEQMPIDIAQPESVEDLIRAFKMIPDVKWLVVQYVKPVPAMDYEGMRLKNLPPSAQAMLAGRVDTKAKRAPDFEYYTFETPYYIRGRAMLALRVISDTGR